MPAQIQIRCPVCGKPATAAALKGAGTHQLEWLKARGLGRGKGFAWNSGPLAGRGKILAILLAALEAATARVRQAIEGGDPAA